MHQDSLLTYVQEAFQVILDFRTSTETLYRYTLEDEVRVDSKRDSQRVSPHPFVLLAPISQA